MDNNKDQLLSDSSLISRKKLLTSLGIGGMALLPKFGMSQSQKLTSKRTFISNNSYNVKDYGATGDGKTDDSAAFQEAIDDIATAGRGVLYIPKGDYRIDNRISKSITRWDLTIMGDGQGVSRIYCTNADGIFQFSHNSRGSQTTIHDISFFADRSGAGVAIEIHAPEGGNLHSRSLIVQNIEMRGVERTEDYFDFGIKSFGQWRPLFFNVIFSGPFGPGVDREDPNSQQYEATCGLQANGAYAPSFQNCYVWSAHTGYNIISTDKPRAPEDCAFYRSFAVGCKVGIDISTESVVEPQLQMDTCHINCMNVGLRLHNRKYFSITNTLFYGRVYRTRKPLPYSDIRLTGSVGGLIQGNIFHQPFNPTRKNIEISSSQDIQITGNYFNAEGTAIVAESTAKNIVAANNQYTSNVTEIVEDKTAADFLFATNEVRRTFLNRESNQKIERSVWTNIIWEEANVDSVNSWAGNDQIIIPENKGIHAIRLSANISWESNQVGQRQVQFSKNGESFVGNGQASHTVSPTSRKENESDIQNIQSAIISVRAGDVLRVSVRQTSDQILSLKADRTWFSVEVIDC